MLATGPLDRSRRIAGQARRRATLAVDALAGHRPTPHWSWLAGAGAVGAVIGWATGSAARALADRDEEKLHRIETMRPVEEARAVQETRAGDEARAVEEIEFLDVGTPDGPLLNQT